MEKSSFDVFPFSVIVTSQSTPKECDLLLENFREKYFKNIATRVLSYSALCQELNIKHDIFKPKDVINKVILKLTERKEETTILMIDELYACSKVGQTTLHWNDVTTADNVVWIFSLAPASDSSEMINLSPPVSDKVLSTKLVRGYRNCLEIRSVVISSFYISYQLQNRQFSIWWVSHHYKERYISMEDDVPVEGDELPQGSTPIWIDVPRDTTQLEILKEMDKLTSSRSVTVLFWSRESSAAEYCRDKGRLQI